jgi:hypothetical protein
MQSGRLIACPGVILGFQTRDFPLPHPERFNLGALTANSSKRWPVDRGR